MPAPAEPQPRSAVLAKPSLAIRRHIRAAPERVYAAWTQPEALARWFGPGDPAAMRRVELDVRVGGRFHIGFDHEGEDHDVCGVYKEVIPGEKLVFTWAWKSTPERQSLVTVLCRPDGAGCLMTLIHEQFYDEAAKIGHTRGWTAALDKLEALFAGEDAP